MGTVTNPRQGGIDSVPLWVTHRYWCQLPRRWNGYGIVSQHPPRWEPFLACLKCLISPWVCEGSKHLSRFEGPTLVMRSLSPLLVGWSSPAAPGVGLLVVRSQLLWLWKWRLVLLLLLLLPCLRLLRHRRGWLVLLPMGICRERPCWWRPRPSSWRPPERLPCRPRPRPPPPVPVWPPPAWATANAWDGALLLESDRSFSTRTSPCSSSNKSKSPFIPSMDVSFGKRGVELFTTMRLISRAGVVILCLSSFMRMMFTRAKLLGDNLVSPHLQGLDFSFCSIMRVIFRFDRYLFWRTPCFWGGTYLHHHFHYLWFPL